MLHTDRGALQLPQPPQWMQEVWRAGGLVPFVRQHGRFPGEAAR
jgi:methanogen homoaconitase small subunit